MMAVEMESPSEAEQNIRPQWLSETETLFQI